MSHFTENEIAYLTSQRLGRIATVNAAGEPHVVPVRFVYNAELDTIDVGGRFNGKSKKYRDAGRNPKVAFVVDDVPEAGTVRGIEIRGRAEAIPTGGETILPGFDPEFIRIAPTRIVSWGIDTHPYQPNSRTVGE